MTHDARRLNARPPMKADLLRKARRQRRAPVRRPADAGARARARCASPCARRRSIASTSSCATAFRTCRCRRFRARTARASSTLSARASRASRPATACSSSPASSAARASSAAPASRASARPTGSWASTSPGTFAELVVVPARNVFPIPARPVLRGGGRVSAGLPDGLADARRPRRGARRARRS